MYIVALLYPDFSINAYFLNRIDMHFSHCVKYVRIRSYSGPHFPAFRLNMERYGGSVFSPNA